MTVKFTFAIVVNDNDEFLIIRRSSTDKWMPLKWYLPGGTIEKKESSIDAVVRETFEEVNLNLDKKKIVSLIERGEVEFFLCEPGSWNGNVELKLTDGILENDLFEWVSKQDLNMFELVPGLDSLLELSKKRLSKITTEDILLQVIREEVKASYKDE